MATPPPSTTTATTHNITPLTIYLLALSLLAGVVVSTAFYLMFGLFGAIITFVLYTFAMGCTFGCKYVMKVVFFPRYDMLSERRKGQVDEVRERGLKRLMEGFTFTLEKEDMMQDSTSSIAPTVTEFSVSSSSCLEHFNSSLECSEDEVYDVELGHITSHSAVKSSDDNDGHDTVTSTSSCEFDIVLNLYKNEDNACASSDAPTTTSPSSLVATESAAMSSTVPTENTRNMQISCPDTEVMEGPSSDDTDPTILSSKEEDNAVFTTTTTTPTRREVLMTDCSICRSSYEPTESICYSSNPQCPHVFHSDCMIQWLVALGRRNDAIVIGHGKKLNEVHLLDYTLSCPCCRQPFVKKSEVRKRVGEEKVLGNTDNMSEGGTHVEEMEEEEDVEHGNQV